MGGAFVNLVSVIVPVYKVEPYLEKCLDSICSQSYKNLEIILIDDGSPDNCGAICDNYAMKDMRIKVVHKENAGLGMARNSGLEVATGKYVVFVDSDDWMEPDMVQTLIAAARGHSAEMVICGYRMVSPEGYTRDCSVCKHIESYEGTEEITNQILAPIVGPKWIDGVENVQEMCVWTNLYSMELIREHNLRFVNEREFLSEDFFFNIAYITKTKKIVRIPEMLYCYRYNENSLSNVFRPNRISLLNNLVRSAMKLLQDEKIYGLMSERLKRTYIKKLRHGLMHIAQAKIPYREKMLQYKEAVQSETICLILTDYPSKEVPLKEQILVALLKKQWIFLTHIYLVMQVLLIAVRQRMRALRK